MSGRPMARIVATVTARRTRQLSSTIGARNSRNLYARNRARQNAGHRSRPSRIDRPTGRDRPREGATQPSTGAGSREGSSPRAGWKRSRPSVAGFAPDLAIEILSKSNTRAEMARKRRAYFAGGTRAVWEINPRRRTVTVYTNPISSDRLIETDTLDGGDVLPGFKLRLSELFTDPLG